MAYTYHTVESALRELRPVESLLRTECARLRALEARAAEAPEFRDRGAELECRRWIAVLTRRRGVLNRELEKARENERRGIRPLPKGPGLEGR